MRETGFKTGSDRFENGFGSRTSFFFDIYLPTKISSLAEDSLEYVSGVTRKKDRMVKRIVQRKKWQFTKKPRTSTYRIRGAQTGFFSDRKPDRKPDRIRSKKSKPDLG